MALWNIMDVFYYTCLWYQILKNGVSQNDCKKLLHEQQLFFLHFLKFMV